MTKSLHTDTGGTSRTLALPESSGLNSVKQKWGFTVGKDPLQLKQFASNLIKPTFVTLRIYYKTLQNVLICH